MYYLIIENMGMERCIDMSETDHYHEGMSFDCTLGIDLADKTFVRDVRVRCKANPGLLVPARIFRD